MLTGLIMLGLHLFKKKIEENDLKDKIEKDNIKNMDETQILKSDYSPLQNQDNEQILCSDCSELINENFILSCGCSLPLCKKCYYIYEKKGKCPKCKKTI